MRTPFASAFAAFLLLAASSSGAPVRRPTPSPRPAVPTPVPLTLAMKTQGLKALAAEVSKRQSLRSKLPAPPRASAGFQAHRCAVVHDEAVTERERAANGPFRTTCSDWVSRATKELAVRDGQRPCTAAQYGPGLVGCTSWVDSWNAGAGKWDEVWRKSVP